MKKTIKTILIAIGLALMFVSIQGLGGGFLGVYYAVQSAASGLEPDPDGVTNFILSKVNWLILINYSLVVLITWIVFLIKKVKVREYLHFKTFNLKQLPLLLCYALTLQLIGGYIIKGIDYIYPMSESYQSMVDAMQTGNLLFSILSLAIVAPVVEELFFRGVMFTKLKNHTSTKVAMLIQAVLFGLIHFNAAQLIPTFLLGCIAAYMYEKYNNIWVPIAFHMVFNLIAVISVYQPENIQLIIGYSSYFAGAFTVIIFLRNYYEKKNKDDLKVNEETL